MTCRLFVGTLLTLTWAMTITGDDAPPAPDTGFGDSLLRQYLRAETARLTENCLSDIATLEDWTSRREEYRRQLREMLGLDPLPERTPLEAVVTGTVDHPEFTVENLHLQSRPGLYVTGNLYLPKETDGPSPAVLYVCGHGRVKKDGISYGNKTNYQHHGAWLARHGYVCLTIDTIQLGEIEGLHHGTYREKMWWWHSRGYTPAGVEAWNCIRALDYLQSRPEVDGERLGVTGRSGGGAYSWWIAALDERIKVAIPVAGITSLQNHVVDDCIEGHCDCMFMVNSHRWDFPLLAALVAPRPLLISNTDKDRIFPLDGVYDVYVKTRRIYQLYGATDRLGLHITEGPHQDTQELRVHAFVWLDRFLKEQPRELAEPAVKLFEPEELKVFEELPEDERVTAVQEWFVSTAERPDVPRSADEWSALRDRWMAALRKNVLDESPPTPAPCEKIAEFHRDGLRIERYRLFTDGIYPLDLYTAIDADVRGAVEAVALEILDQPAYERLASAFAVGVPELVRGESTAEGRAEWEAIVGALKGSQRMRSWFAPRGIGPTEWTRDTNEQTHILRRFALLGKTADELQTYDAVQAVRAIRGLPAGSVNTAAASVTLRGERTAAGWGLFAALLAPEVQRLELVNLPATHDDAPIYLQVRRYFDIPEALALAAEQCPIRVELAADDVATADFAAAAADALDWGDDRVEVYTETEENVVVE